MSETQISIAGTTFTYFPSIELSLQLDGHAAVKFEAPFDPNVEAQRELFRPFARRDLTVTVNNRVRLTGFMLDVVPAFTANETRVSVSGYSLPAWLRDCCPLPGKPRQFERLTLDQIAKELCDPYQIEVQPSTQAGAAFAKVAIDATAKVHSFLEDLAKQRGFVVSSTPEGKLAFIQSKSQSTTPVARFRQGEPPLVSVAPNTNAGEYYSHIVCRAKAKTLRGGQTRTATNPFSGQARPVFLFHELDDTEPGDIQKATDAALGRMLGNAASYNLEIATHETPAGELFQPGDYVTLHAPGSMVYQESTLLVREVSFQTAADQQNAVLVCTLPGSFSGEKPDGVPWQG